MTKGAEANHGAIILRHNALPPSQSVRRGCGRRIEQNEKAALVHPEVPKKLHLKLRIIVLRSANDQAASVFRDAVDVEKIQRGYLNILPLQAFVEDL